MTSPFLTRLLCATAGTITAVAALGFGNAATARAEAVVVASSAPGYKLGQLVPDGQSVQLPDGANATFLFANGRTLRLRGPYEGALGDTPAPGKETRAGTGNDRFNDRFMQSDLGAARAFGNPLDGALERIFVLDPAVSGTYCIKAGSSPLLRHPADPGLDRVQLQDANGKTSAPVTWNGSGNGNAANATVPWPRVLPLSDGSEIRVVRSDGKPNETLRFRTVEATSSAALTVRMAAAGCTGQVGMAMASLRDAIVPLDLFLTADRGPASYRPGDEIRLLVQTDRNAHVYCYLRNARAQLIPIFPAGASRSAEVQGNAPLSLPGDRMPLPLRAGDSPGDMEVRCVAASRSLDDEMPGRAAAFRPLTDEDVAQLDRTVSRLRDTEVASAQLVLKVR